MSECDDGDVAERLCRLHETIEAVRENSVVVRAQEPHQCVILARSRQIARTTRSESLQERKWLGAPYVVGTMMLATRKPARAAAHRGP